MSTIKIKEEKEDKDKGSKSKSQSLEKETESDNVQKQFEKRLYELVKEFPKGIPDKILQNDMPSISPGDRAIAINRLLTEKVLDVYKQSGPDGELLYKLKTETSLEPDEIKHADNEEKVVFDIIKEAGNMGIWIRDIRVKSNLNHQQLNKIVKLLENKKLIKAVKSVAAAKKKVYMLFELEPHRSLTGGAWYSGQDFETEFVTILNQQCHKYLVDKKLKAARSLEDVGPLEKMKMAYTTLDELHLYISKLGISTVDLTKDDIESILKTLIYDGKIEKVMKGDEVFYWAVDSVVFEAGLVQTPCGVCPVFKDCTERGPINPGTCVYLTNWLASDF